ncbi:MAG: PAS domain S-box protein [Spirochaetes bacterium]|nr:PAS domain S-box protein [Spirochaetota bacterium]
METSKIFDILQFTNCDFIVTDSSLHVIYSNNPNAIHKKIDDVFPYYLISEDLKSYFNNTSNSIDKNQIILESPNQSLPYVFSIHKINNDAPKQILVLSRLKNNFSDTIQKIYEELYNIKIFDDDTKHFVEVLKYILDTVIKVTGMDCGGIYVIDPLTQHLKLTFAQGVSESFIEKVSEYKPDSWNYQMIIKGTPQYIDYTTMDLDDNDFRKQEGIKAIAAIPVVFRNNVIGVINIGSHSTNIIPGYIKPLLEVISQQLGIVIDKFMMKSLLAQSSFDNEKIAAIHDVVYQVDRDTIIRYISPNIKNFIGFTPSEMIGKSFVEFIYPEDLPMVLESYERSKKRIFEPLEYRLKTKDGSYRYILTISEAHYDEQGNFIGLSGVGTDIHEKKVAEIKLKESEEKFKTLANSVLTSIFIIQDNRMQWINPATIDILEYPEEEIIGKPFWVFVHPDDVEQAKLRAAARQRGEKVINRYEARIVTKSNTVKWLDFHVATIQYNGRIAILGSATDITDRKTIELQLKTSEEKFFKAFHSSPIPMTINTFKDGVYREVNEAACDTFGYPLHEVIGRSILELNVFADRDELEKYVKELQENKRVKDFAVTFRTKNGLLKNCIINSDVYMASGEKLVISSIIDVTQIKRSAQIIYEQYRELQQVNRDLTKTKEELTLKNIQLHNEKERLNRILESINDAVIVTDNEGKIIVVNKATCTILQKEIESLIGQKAFNILDLDCKQPVEVNFDDILQKLQKSSITNECTLFVNHVSYNIELHILPLKDHTGNISGAVIVIRDITQKKKMEEHIAQTTKLESIGLLAAGIAHDFNNILTSIVGNLSIIKNKINHSAEFYTNIQEAENASFRAKELTQQLLTFAKGGTPVKKITQIHNLIKETATFVLRGSAIKCNFFIDDDLWHVEADEGQISQVIQNIVINAREAMEDKGVLNIYASNVKDDDPILSIIGKEKFIRISIQDNGPGINNESIEKIFDPYYTTKPHGTGLGLTVVYSIIKQHGGFIFVDSQLNKGTRFDIYLKATDKQIAHIENQLESTLISGKGKILVLEDDENIQFILKAMLQELGYEVDIANDGDEAYSKYLASRTNQQPYTFAIMDLTVPGKKGGKDTIALIRQIDNEFKVIVSSGYSNDPVMSNYREYGFNGILPKPYRFEDLKQIIASLKV